MDNQAKDLELEKNGARLSQTWKEENAKRELENARKKKASSWRKQDLRIACKNFIWSSIFNLKVYIIFVNLNELNISLDLNFDLHRNK